MHVLKHNVFITEVFGFKLEKSLHGELKPKDPDWLAILNPQVLLKLSDQDGPMETYSRDTETGTDTKKKHSRGKPSQGCLAPKALPPFPNNLLKLSLLRMDP